MMSAHHRNDRFMYFLNQAIKALTLSTYLVVHEETGTVEKQQAPRTPKALRVLSCRRAMDERFALDKNDIYSMNQGSSKTDVKKR